MNVTLNAIEVLDIAQQIERNGAMYYRKASQLFSDSDISNMFLDLAEWENRHEQVFKDISKDIVKQYHETTAPVPEKKEFDPKLMACLAVFGTASDPLHKLKSIRKITDVLNKAIEKEKDSIAFYDGLKDFVTDIDDQNKVNAIIEEEMHHIKILNQALKERE